MQQAAVALNINAEIEAREKKEHTGPPGALARISQTFLREETVHFSQFTTERQVCHGIHTHIDRPIVTRYG